MYIAIDIGGTKTDIGFFGSSDLASRMHLSNFNSLPTYQQQKEKILSEIHKILPKKTPIKGVGLAIPGIVTNNEIEQISNLPDYKDKPFFTDLVDALGTTEIKMIQDSPCAALAEYQYGNIRSFSKIVHLIMGTGLGGTLIEKREKLVLMPFEPCGLIVDVHTPRAHEHCTTLGLLEAYVGGGTVEHFYEKPLATIKDDDSVWEEITDYLAVGINNINCLYKPDIVIIGGGIGEKRKSALRSVISKTSKYDEFVKPCKVEFTSLKGNASLAGALAVLFTKDVKFC